jgi:hypothetical protein
VIDDVLKLLPIHVSRECGVALLESGFPQETCGSRRKQKCGILWRLYIQNVHVFSLLPAFPRGSEESQNNAVLSAHHSFAAPIFARPAPARTIWTRRNVLKPECRDFIEIQRAVEIDSSATSFSSF